MFEEMRETEYVELVIDYALGWEEGLTEEGWRQTTIDEIREAVKQDRIYEELTDDEFNRFCEAILRRVHNDADAEA